MTDTNQLPPLPEPEGVIVVGTQALRGFTADQMRAYALQARAQVQGEPFAWVEHHKGGDNLVWDEPGGRKSPLYTTPQPDQATQAEVTDEKILKTLRPDVWMHVEGLYRERMLADARAILALRPSTAPNLSCRSVQARLADQWGYVRPAAVPSLIEKAISSGCFDVLPVKATIPMCKAGWGAAGGELTFQQIGHVYEEMYKARPLPDATMLAAQAKKETP